jgi:hypothetical protein
MWIHRQATVSAAHFRPSFVPSMIGNVDAANWCNCRQGWSGVNQMSMRVRKSWRGIKHFIAATAALAVTALTSPAMAYVVEVTTSIDLTDVAHKVQLLRAVESAVDDVLANAISFSPTVITVQDARVLGDRMYLLLLIVDAAGERVLEAIAGDEAVSRDSEGRVDATTPRSTRWSPTTPWAAIACNPLWCGQGSNACRARRYSGRRRDARAFGRRRAVGVVVAAACGLATALPVPAQPPVRIVGAVQWVSSTSMAVMSDHGDPSAVTEGRARTVASEHGPVADDRRGETW